MKKGSPMGKVYIEGERKGGPLDCRRGEMHPNLPPVLMVGTSVSSFTGGAPEGKGRAVGKSLSMEGSWSSKRKKNILTKSPSPPAVREERGKGSAVC